MGRGESRFEVRDEPDRRSRRGVAAVEDRVDADGRDALPGRQLDDRDEVTVVRVDAAGPDEADEVERAALARPPARTPPGARAG